MCACVCVCFSGLLFFFFSSITVLVRLVDSSGSAFELSELPWPVSELASAIESATRRFFAPEVWRSAPAVSGLVLQSSDEPLLDRVLLRGEDVSSECDVIDADDLKAPLIVQLCSFSGKAGPSAAVTVSVVSGGQLAGNKVATASFAKNTWILLADEIAMLDASAVLLFSVSHGAPTQVVEHVHVPLCDEGGRLRTGSLQVELWQGRASKFQLDIGAPPVELASGSTLSIWIGPPEKLAPTRPIVFRSGRLIELLCAKPQPLHWNEVAISILLEPQSDPDTVELQPMLRSSRGRFSANNSERYCPIEKIAPDQKLLFWETRNPSNPNSVARALSAIDLSNPVQRKALIEFVEEVNAAGTRLYRFSAFQLLLHMHASELIRHFATRQMFAWDGALGDFALPGVSVLSFSPHDCNPAVVEHLRALSSPRRVAIPGDCSNFYWMLFSLAQVCLFVYLFICFVLFCIVLFCFFLFCFVLFCFVLFIFCFSFASKTYKIKCLKFSSLLGASQSWSSIRFVFETVFAAA